MNKYIRVVATYLIAILLSAILAALMFGLISVLTQALKYIADTYTANKVVAFCTFTWFFLVSMFLISQTNIFKKSKGDR